jgi:(p)ppGpp synthase/HD superfamily hydrolase
MVFQPAQAVEGLRAAIACQMCSASRPAATAMLPTATACTEGDEMNDLTRVMQAADMAARWHVHQRRKGQAAEPYINHLLEVAFLVTTATEGREPDVVIAALLHDAVEDQEVTIELIAREYGQEVAGIVGEVTDDKSLPKAERKRLQVETAGHKSREARLIKLADKTSNLRAIANSPPPDWSVERRLDYVRWASEVVAQIRGTSPWLEQQFDEAARAASLTA